MPAVVASRPAEPSAGAAQTAGEELSLKRLLEVSTVVLQQAVDLVDNDLTSDEQLSVHSQYMPGSTIGESQSSRVSRIPVTEPYLLVNAQESTCAMPEITSPFLWIPWRHNPLMF